MAKYDGKLLVKHVVKPDRDTKHTTYNKLSHKDKLVMDQDTLARYKIDSASAWHDAVRGLESKLSKVKSELYSRRHKQNLDDATYKLMTHIISEVEEELQLVLCVRRYVIQPQSYIDYSVSSKLGRFG